MADDNGVQAVETWPDFELPPAVGAGDTPAPPAASAATPAPPPATPADGAVPPAQPPTPSGEAAAPVVPVANETIPKYRLDEQRQHFESIITSQTKQIADLTALVRESITNRTPSVAPTEVEPPNEQDLAIRDRLLAVFPELKMLEQLKPLAERRDALLGSADSVERYNKAETTYFDRYAERTLNAIFDKIAVLTLGDGKTHADVAEMVRPGVTTSFHRWVTQDPQRSARYEGEDPKLIDEFWTAYKAAVYDPIRRDANAALLTKAQNPPAVPIGGGSAPLAAATPPSHINLDEDAVHKLAWANRDSVGA